MKFRVVLQTLSPLAVSRSRATGNQLETQRHIPGAMWRGALAAEWIRRRNLGTLAHQEPGFFKVFLSGAVHFSDLRIEGHRPWPISARECKLYPDLHPKHDFLAGPRLFECPECTAKLSSPVGYYRPTNNGFTTCEVPQRVTAHTAISGESLRVRAEQFFTSEVIEAGQRFEGSLSASDSAADLVAREWGGEEEHFVTIGRGATRGQGHAVLRIEEASAPPDAADSMRESLEELNSVYGDPEAVIFTCTLLSPCAVYDQWLLARPWLEAEDIAEAAELSADHLTGYTLRGWHSRMTTLSGWNARAGLPKSDTYAISAGSAFLFGRTLDATKRQAEIRRLAPLLASAGAVGERCHEGMGEAVFCSDIHYRLRGRR